MIRRGDVVRYTDPRTGEVELVQVEELDGHGNAIVRPVYDEGRWHVHADHLEERT